MAPAEVLMRTCSILLAATACVAAGSAAAAPQHIEQVAWLAGCWRGQFGEAGTLEHWLAPAGGTMLGVSRTIRQGKTAEFEFMQLRQLDDGALALIAQPSGRAPTVFKAISLRGMEAVFENPEHDFPQRISYARPEESRLAVSLQGLHNGTVRTVEFAFLRVSCDAETAQEGPSGR
jgi:hypothetical protein